MTTTQESRRGIERKPIERVAARVYLSSNQNDLVSGNWTKVNVNTIDYDLGTNFDTSTYKFTAPVSGLYEIRGKIDFDNVIANKSYAVGIYINNALTIHCFVHTGAGIEEVDAQVAGALFLKANDYVELYALSNAGVNTVDVGGGNHHTILLVRLISKEGARQ